MERRAFLRSIECAAIGALCGGIPASVLSCSGLRYVPALREGNRLTVLRADIGSAPFVLLQHPIIPRSIYLHRHADGAYSAVLTLCSHQGCEVEPAGDRLACPCHGSQYQLTGEVIRGPAERPLRRYDVTIDPEHVYIHLSDV